MEIDGRQILVRELVAGYTDNGEGGVRGYGGELDIRPPFQREFVYKDKQRDAVIETINNGFPLNVMYWAVREGGTYEVIDGPTTHDFGRAVCEGKNVLGRGALFSQLAN